MRPVVVARPPSVTITAKMSSDLAPTAAHAVADHVVEGGREPERQALLVGAERHGHGEHRVDRPGREAPVEEGVGHRVDCGAPGLSRVVEVRRRLSCSRRLARLGPRTRCRPRSPPRTAWRTREVGELRLVARLAELDGSVAPEHHHERGDHEGERGEQVQPAPVDCRPGEGLVTAEVMPF